MRRLRRLFRNRRKAMHQEFGIAIDRLQESLNALKRIHEATR